MKKMTLTANTAHELSRIAEKRSHEEAYAEAEHLIEGHISRTIKAACDKGAFGVDFKFPKEDKLIWDYARIILCHNEYKASIKQSEPVLVVRW
jgi:hypothetical protein